MIQCTCPECAYTYEVADPLAGKSVLCPECQTRFKVKGRPQVKDREEEAEYDDYGVQSRSGSAGDDDDAGDNERRRVPRGQAPSVGLRANNLFGILGSVAIAIALFLPAWTSPHIGSMTVWDVTIDKVPVVGIAILILSVLGFVLSFRRSTRWLIFPAVCILLAGGEVFVRIQHRLEKFAEDLLLRNAFNRLLRGGRPEVRVEDALEAHNIANSISIGIAWIVLAIGIVFLITAACLSQSQRQQSVGKNTKS